MKKYLLIALIVLGNVSVFAQQDEYETMPYVKGDLLIMVDNNENIQDVVDAHRNINGVMTELSLVEAASKIGNIWLLRFNHNNISHIDMLKAIENNPHVVMAQNNHLVTSNRVTTPNDPNFGAQWQHDNIESELAWDITTGGLTANGDEIVVAVLEGGGTDWDHPDLLANHWENAAEASGTNGVDDDGNGYTDDVDGWNVGSGNDNINNGSHGTGVSGMIGAVGNNNSVVAGANWDVKIMQVDMPGGLSETNVIASYAYPLKMRQMYNNSGGTEGAFVVATNASWGIDNGDPASAPLWCAYYDTLGKYGILNFGATANNNVNIDAVGDLPTACGSDYMISVTATNTSDVRTFSGYGQTTIDLGAPGQSIVTTANGGGSNSTSGTSFATPLTAGVCGLMYSVPCSDLATLALTNPQEIADSMRMAIFNSVDPIANLTTETVTGGRLNSFNSVSYVQNSCGLYNTNCTGTFSGAPTSVTGCNGDCNGEIDMSGTGGSGTYQWSIDGGTTWVSTTNFSGLCAGSYTVMVDDGVECQQNIPISVSEPTVVSGTTTSTDVSCNGAADGVLDVTGTGGTPPYQYSIDGGTTFNSTGDFTGLSGGVISVLVEDAEGCQYTTNVGVNEPSVLGTSSSSTDEMLGNDGTINLTVSGGTPPYSFSWTGPNSYTSTVEDPTGLEAGVYNVTVTDANGCTVASGDITVGSSVGIGENDFEFSVYPNPANDQVVISVVNGNQINMVLIDNSGKLVQEGILTNDNNTVDVSKLAAGIYTLKLTTNDGQVSSTKLMIE